MSGHSPMLLLLRFLLAASKGHSAQLRRCCDSTQSGQLSDYAEWINGAMVNSTTYSSPLEPREH